jgi:anti-sigma B factor antagonist
MATTEPLIVQIGLTRMAMEFSLRIRPGSPMPTVEVSGELDLESGPCLREQLRPIMRALGAHLAIDLTGVTFIDCSGVNALLASSRDAQRLGGWMRVAGAAPCVRRLTEITGLQQVLGVSPASPLNGRAESPHHRCRHPRDEYRIRAGRDACQPSSWLSPVPGQRGCMRPVRPAQD